MRNGPAWQIDAITTMWAVEFAPNNFPPSLGSNYPAIPDSWTMTFTLSGYVVFNNLEVLNVEVIEARLRERAVVGKIRHQRATAAPYSGVGYTGGRIVKAPENAWNARAESWAMNLFYQHLQYIS
jgi:hypothetical protein